MYIYAHGEVDFWGKWILRDGRWEFLGKENIGGNEFVAHCSRSKNGTSLEVTNLGPSELRTATILNRKTVACVSKIVAVA